MWVKRYPRMAVNGETGVGVRVSVTALLLASAVFQTVSVASAQTGTVQVCKVAGAGVAIGTDFTFNVAGTPVTVAAGPAPGGTCGTPVTVAAGTAAITEALPAHTFLDRVSTLPAASLISANLTTGTANVTVNSGAQTTVMFFDSDPVLTVVTLDAPYQIRYAAHLDKGESWIDIINDGANGASAFGPGVGGAVGNICVNVYAIDPQEELDSCCSCLITPNQVVNLGVNRDILINPAVLAVPTSVTLKLVGTLPGTGSVPANCANSAALLGGGATIVGGYAAFGTTLHATSTGNAYSGMETAFLPAQFGCATQGQGPGVTSVLLNCGGTSVHGDASGNAQIPSTNISCPQFTLPAGQNLVDIKLFFQDDYSLGNAFDGTNSWTFNWTGIPAEFGLTSYSDTVSGGANSTSYTPSGTSFYQVGVDTTTFASYIGAGSVQVATVSSANNSGALVPTNSHLDANVFIQYDYSAAPCTNTELVSLSTRCGYVIGNLSGFGICNACQPGAMGAAKKQ